MAFFNINTVDIYDEEAAAYGEHQLGTVVFPSPRSADILHDHSLIHYKPVASEYGTKVDDISDLQMYYNELESPLSITIFRYDRPLQQRELDCNDSGFASMSSPSPLDSSKKNSEGDEAIFTSHRLPMSEYRYPAVQIRNKQRRIDSQNMSTNGTAILAAAQAVDDPYNWENYLDDVPEYAPKSGLPLPFWKRKSLAEKHAKQAKKTAN